MPTERFTIQIKEDKIYIKDTVKKREIDLTNKYEVKQLINLMNDAYKVIKTGWGFK